MKTLKTLKHKPGDTVTIKSIDWYNEHKDRYGNVSNPLDKNDDAFVDVMSKWCGVKTVIQKIITAGPSNLNYFYSLKCDDGLWGWYDYMFEDTDETATENS